jgi:mono/diheme cytochrome c family protein
LRNSSLFDAIVLDGVRSENGMVSFAEELSAADTDAIREYVITLALTAQAEQRAAALAEDEDPDAHGN